MDGYRGKVGNHLIGVQLRGKTIETEMVGGGMLFKNKSRIELPQFKKWLLIYNLNKFNDIFYGETIQKTILIVGVLSSMLGCIVGNLFYLLLRVVAHYYSVGTLTISLTLCLRRLFCILLYWNSLLVASWLDCVFFEFFFKQAPI